MSTVAIGSIAAAGIGAAGSLAAGSEQAGASKSAAQLQADEAKQALQFQEKEFDTQQANEAPFLKAGQGAVSQLSDLLQPGGSLAQPWTQQFQAPTIEQAENNPGYQFQEQQGEKAIQNSAAAQGELLDPNAIHAQSDYAQQSAQSDYNTVYNQALQQYQQQYNIFQNNQANQYNRLAGLAGVGTTTAGQLGSEGQAASQNVGNIMLTSGAQQGQDLTNEAAATASGYAGATNAASGALNNIGTTLALKQLLNPPPGSTGQFDTSQIV